MALRDWGRLGVGVLAACCAAGARADVVAHWNFDEGGSAVYGDSVGNGHPATAADRGAVKEYSGEPAAPFGKAVAFDGSRNAYLTIPALKGIQNRSLTVAVWVNLATAGPHYVLTDWENFEKSGFEFGTDASRQSAAPLVELTSLEKIGEDHRYPNNRRTIVRQLLADKPIPQKSWHHVTWVWDRDAETMTMYLDGSSQGTQPRQTDRYGSKTLDIALDDRPMRIGGREVSMGPRSVSTFNGGMDELWLFDQALTPIQIRNLMRYNDVKGQPGVANSTPTAPPAIPVRSVAVGPDPSPVEPSGSRVAVAPVTPTVRVSDTPTGGDASDDRQTVPLGAASGKLGAGRVFGIVICLGIVVGMACYLIWAVTERGKLRAAGRL